MFKLISGSVSAGTLWKLDWLRQPLPPTLARRLGPGAALTKLKGAPPRAAQQQQQAAPAAYAPAAALQLRTYSTPAPAPAPAPAAAAGGGGAQWPPAAETWTTRALDLAQPGAEADAVQAR